MKEKIENVIEELINPKLKDHNGWVELVEIENNDAYIRFRGACSGCMSTTDTFDKTVKPLIKNHVKEVNEVYEYSEVSEELLDIARNILLKENK